MEGIANDLGWSGGACMLRAHSYTHLFAGGDQSSQVVYKSIWQNQKKFSMARLHCELLNSLDENGHHGELYCENILGCDTIVHHAVSS